MLLKNAKREELHSLSQRINVPKFVKTASVDGWNSLQPAGYAAADTDYPIHSRAATWFSVAKFLEKRATYDREKREFLEYCLKEAAGEWKVDYEGIARDMEREPEEPDDYVLTKKARGELHQIMPLTDGNSVDKAADYLYKYRSRLPYSWRKEAARKILGVAQQRDVTPRKEAYLLKAAGLGVSTRKEVVRAILQRAVRVEDPDVQRNLRKYAAEWKEKDEVDFEELHKCANLLGEIDERGGFVEEYGEDYLTPEEGLFRQTARKAAECQENYVELANGRTVHKSQIEGVPLGKVASAVGGPLRAAMNSVMLMDWNDFKKAATKLGPSEADTLCLFLGETKDEGEWESFV